MPEVVKTYIQSKNFRKTLGIQQLLADYEEDITKYAVGLNKAKLKSIYSHISTFLAKENKRFQIMQVPRDSLIPVEVKAMDGPTASLNNLLKDGQYSDDKYGIKFGYKNIGFNGKFYTFPYFLGVLLRRFLVNRCGIL